jgi:23S rRNA pseudouridine1911/1915/1917 synthase
LKRGFRHQIRCHLAWTGFPILNDPVYGGAESAESAQGFLALSAAGLFFEDPRDKSPREYRIHPLEIP